nr:hypothetical protein [Burkholderia ubonensis]
MAAIPWPGWIPIISTRDSLPDWSQNSASGYRESPSSATCTTVLLGRILSINTLGFAGSLFVRDAAQMQIVRTLGPMAVLRRAAGAPAAA